MHWPVSIFTTIKCAQCRRLIFRIEMVTKAKSFPSPILLPLYCIFNSILFDNYNVIFVFHVSRVELVHIFVRAKVHFSCRLTKSKQSRMDLYSTQANFGSVCFWSQMFVGIIFVIKNWHYLQFEFQFTQWLNKTALSVLVTHILFPI